MIGRSGNGPRVIAFGVVERIRELPPRKDTGEIWASDVTLSVGDGAVVFVRFRQPANDADLAALVVGEPAAIWGESRSGSRGEELWFDSFVTPDDIDRLNTAVLGVPVKA